MASAERAEAVPGAVSPLIVPLTCSLRGQEATVVVNREPSPPS
jgi:hypothetical protein